MAWYNSNWQYRKKVTVDYTKVSADLTDFPVYVDLADAGSDFFSNVKTDGSDIVVTSSDGTTKLSRELVSIDTSGQTGELHFKAPSLSSSTNTDFYIYYGNASASETNDTSTWDSNFLIVTHMKDDPDTSHVADSTSNGYNGTKAAANKPIETTGNFGKAQSFDGVDNSTYITVSGTTSLLTGLTQATMSCWVNFPKSSNAQHFVVIRDGGNDFYIAYPGGNNSYLDVQIDVAWLGAISLTPAFTDFGNWAHLAITRNSTSFKAYVNGVEAASSNAVPTDAWTDTWYDLLYGATLNWSPDYTRVCQGDIDEVQVSKVERSSDWIATTYNNGNSPSTFYSIGAQETNNQPPATPTNSSPANGATNVSLTPTLQASAFSDPDGDGHAASQWQITTVSGDYSSPVFDSGEDTTNLTSITLPSALDPATTYYWHVRYKDDNSSPLWSSYSAETSFTTKDLRISGKVLKDGVGVQGAKLYLIDRTTDSVVDTTTTDVNGDYYFSKLDSSKTYHVCVEYETGGQKYRADSHWAITPAEVDI